MAMPFGPDDSGTSSRRTELKNCTTTIRINGNGKTVADRPELANTERSVPKGLQLNISHLATKLYADDIH